MLTCTYTHYRVHGSVYSSLGTQGEGGGRIHVDSTENDRGKIQACTCTFGLPF